MYVLTGYIMHKLTVIIKCTLIVEICICNMDFKTMQLGALFLAVRSCKMNRAQFCLLDVDGRRLDGVAVDRVFSVVTCRLSPMALGSTTAHHSVTTSLGFSILFCILTWILGLQNRISLALFGSVFH